MPERAAFVSLGWIEGTTSFDHGTNGKPPRNAIKEAGGRRYKMYGKDYLVWNRPKMILAVKSESGIEYRKDIYDTVKYFVPKRRFTTKFREELRVLFVNSEFTIKDEQIGNLYNILGEYFKK